MSLLARIAARQDAPAPTTDRCSSLLARACSGAPVGTFDLTISPTDHRRLPLCQACHAIAEHYGWHPIRLARWLELRSAKDLTGRAIA